MKMIERKVGGITVLAPDYSEPGVAEAVKREVNDAMLWSESSRSSLGVLYLMWRENAR